MKPIDLGDRLGRWSSGRGPLPVLLSARLRRLIDEGELAPGEPLPPDRALATVLAVGRSTVVAAYEELRREGRIVRRQGSGTRVAGAGAGAPPPELVEAYAAMLPRLAATSGDIGYYPAGHPALRQAIADRYAARGIATGPERILVTGGAQQALSLLARALLVPGDRVLAEAPTYPGALEAFRGETAVTHGLPVGLTGLRAAAAEHRAALAYVIPTFHNPTGFVLPLLPRRALAQTAAAAGVPLIDDEVLSELGFPGEAAPPPLAAYAGGVISVGSLSKVAWGGLRVGWVRAPEPLIARLTRLQVSRELGGNVPGQLAAAELLPRLGPLIARQAAQREARHDHLRAELARYLPGWEAPPVRGGQTLWVRLPRGDGSSFAQEALQHQVAVLPGSGFDASGQSEDRLRIHFLAEPDVLTEAVRRLARAWHAYRPPPVTGAR